MGEELPSKASRMRSRFIRLMDKRLEELQIERNEILKTYAELDEHGHVKTEVDEKTGKEIYVIADLEGYKFEMSELMNESCVIDENEERVEMMQVIREIVLETNRTFSGQSAFEYDRWCEIAESH